MTAFTCKLCSWQSNLPWWAEKFPAFRLEAVDTAFSALEDHLYMAHGKAVASDGSVFKTKSLFASAVGGFCSCNHPIDHIHNNNLIEACIECGLQTTGNN